MKRGDKFGLVAGLTILIVGLSLVAALCLYAYSLHQYDEPREHTRVDISGLNLLSVSTNDNYSEYLECPSSRIYIGTPVCIAVCQITSNIGYGVVVPHSQRILADFNNTESYDRFIFYTSFKQSDVSKYDYIKIQLVRVEGEELLLCDELYLSLEEMGGIPFLLLPEVAFLTILAVVVLYIYVGFTEWRKKRQKVVK